jgi:hypothetical protein
MFIGTLFDTLGFNLIGTVQLIIEDSSSHRWINDTYIGCQRRMDTLAYGGFNYVYTNLLVLLTNCGCRFGLEGLPPEFLLLFPV